MAAGGPRPPLYFLAALSLQALLHWQWPLQRIIPAVLSYFGAVFVVLGILMVVLPAREFDIAKTDIDPFGSPSVLKTEGWFRVSRNPMYLGMASVLLGVALLLRTTSPFLVVPAFVALLTMRFIRHEEATLTRTFGTPYEEYRRRTRRWL